VEGDIATVGITNYAQHALGDIVFVDLPEVGKTVSRGMDLAVVESVKAASDVFAPLSGEVVEVNNALITDTSLINISPMDAGWFVKLRITAPEELDRLMDQSAYDTHIKDH
jgi:glycine cleavage system H protein